LTTGVTAARVLQFHFSYPLGSPVDVPICDLLVLVEVCHTTGVGSQYHLSYSVVEYASASCACSFLICAGDVALEVSLEVGWRASLG